ncbi:hypothetical protein KDN24_14320 [Bacillus sp. Bva_UNVM-123]|uniref:hypothetical protein n=1 Tax=Bacillus sp. Bva_UNVM-123 TaxID=2829798 RepID=UPI00391F877C
MESSPFRNGEGPKRQNRLKTFIYGIVVAVLIISGINLITPAYGRFFSPQEDKIDVQACFIFPKTIEEHKEQTDKLRWEAEDLMDELIGKISELEITEMNERMEELEKSSNETHIPDSSGENQIDSSTIEGLRALQSALQAEISAIESTITANEQRISDLENAITELESLISAIENVIENDIQAVKMQVDQKLEEILELIQYIEEIKDRAMEECNYDPLFFSERLAQMDFNKQVTENLLQKLEEEHAQLTEQIQKFSDQVTAMKVSITSIQSENESLAGQISGLMNQIASIDQLIEDLAEQIRIAEEKKKLEEHEKLMEELRKLEEEIRIDEEIKQREKEKEKERENKGSEKSNELGEESNEQEEYNTDEREMTEMDQE